MFAEFFSFELRSRFKNINVYIFFALLFLITFMFIATDNLRIGGDLGNVNKNSPFTIMLIISTLSTLGLFFTTAIMSFTATRDFDNKYDQIMFTAPISKFGYFFGRFFAAVVASSVIFLGANLGFLIAPLMPWVDSEQIGAVMLSAHLNSFLIVVLPNVIFSGAVMFSLAMLTRSNLYTFIGALILLVSYVVVSTFMSDLDNQDIASLFDPFGGNSIGLQSKYWTIAEKNTNVMGLDGLVLMNRLVWLSLSVVILFFTYRKFTFETAGGSKKKGKAENKEENDYKVSFLLSDKVVPTVRLDFSTKTIWLQFFNQIKIEVQGIVRSVPFIVISIAAIISLMSAAANAGKSYDTPVFPVTYIMLGVINGSYNLFLFAIIMYYSGVLVWRERDAKINELYDASPFPSWIPFFSKTIALISIPAILSLLAIVVCVLMQAKEGYYNFELGLYFFDLMVIDLSNYALLAVLAMFLQVIFNNRYLGYLSFIVIFSLQLFAFNGWDIFSNLFKYAGAPFITYSDMNGYGPYLESLAWFRLYWGLFAAALMLIAAAFWVRGKSNSFKERLNDAKKEYARHYKVALPSILVLWLVVGAWVFYNTKVLNTIRSTKEREKNAVAYEKKYKYYEKALKPRIVAVKCAVDLFPEESNAYSKVDLLLVNKNDTQIDSLYFSTDETDEYKFEIPNAKVAYHDKELGFLIYKLDKPLQTGDTMAMSFSSQYERKGFENQPSANVIAANGTFFNSSAIMPIFGYSTGKTLQDKKKRKENDLPAIERMPEQTDSMALKNTYISEDADWITFEAVVSTSKDQIAIAPGSLVKEWTKDNRRYFHYKLEHKALSFFSFMSARYEVERQKWNGIDIEVYYHKAHGYNVERMVKSMKASLGYYIENFGAYPHKQCRIIEFPRYASFAQAFPGTMPYSEAIGFISKIDDEKDIDFVYYVVAHEMAHQWWAHQVIGAAVKGATLMSETMSQYSALMVMEKMYGREKINKFLKYEMDRYLGGRGSEEIKEQPLMYNEAQQYIHYRKGSVIMYALRDYIGEDSLNAALKRYVSKVAYQEPPYTASREFVSYVSQAVPDSLKYLVTDFFENITLYDNRMTNASMEKLANGDYKVKFKVSVAKVYADSIGNEKPQPLADWIDIGILKEVEEKGKKTDKNLFVKRVKFTQKDNEFEFIVKEKPDKVMIDPTHLLIDRVPSDNFKSLSEGSESK